MTWVIDGVPDEFFPDEWYAMARAWQLVPPGTERAQVRQISEDPPPDTVIETATIEGTELSASVSLHGALRMSTAAVQDALMRELEGEADKRHLFYDPQQVEFTTHALGPDWELEASVTAWPKDAIANGVPPAGTMRVVVPVTKLF